MRQLKEITAYDGLVVLKEVISSVAFNFLAVYGAICLVKNIILLILQ